MENTVLTQKVETELENGKWLKYGKGRINWYYNGRKFSRFGKTGLWVKFTVVEAL